MTGASPIRVLVVDDDFMVAKLHSAWVSHTDGFCVVGFAHTAEQALQAVTEYGLICSCWTCTCLTEAASSCSGNCVPRRQHWTC